MSEMTAVFVLLGVAFAGMASPAVAARDTSVLSSVVYGRRPTHPRLVEVTATDYAFRMPDSLPAGTTELRLRNSSSEPHQMKLFRLDSGKTLEDLVATRHGPRPFPAWAHSIGGPDDIDPGLTATAIVVLTPGSYVAWCSVTLADGVPHWRKGMIKQIEVVGPEPLNAILPRTDATVSMTEYGYTFSRHLSAGRHALMIVNRGKQDHAFGLLKLRPGKTLADYRAWSRDRRGPEPDISHGGASDLAPGDSMVVVETFTPGRYIARCFVLDAVDGKRHSEHGMVMEFVVR